MNEKRQNTIYLLLDVIAAIIAWSCFYLFRKWYVEPQRFGYPIPLEMDPNYFLAILIIPVFWVILYAIAGSYNRVHRKSRANELIRTFVVTFLGCFVLFFTLLLDDKVPSYHVYPYTFSVLFLLQFFFTYTFRFSYLTYLKNKIKRKEAGFNTLLIGDTQVARNLYEEIEHEIVPQGYRFCGYVKVNGGGKKDEMKDVMPCLGHFNELSEIIDQYKPEDVIIALENEQHSIIKDIVSDLEIKKTNVKILPEMYDILSGKVKMDYIFGTALIELNSDIMSEWEKNLKRVMDVVASSLVLILASPLYFALALAIRIDSPGPIFYTQERIGQFGNPFKIYKFRTMHKNAERHGPMLSSDNDPRTTNVGRFLRKYRLDELPQFFNVLKGEMSLVGPRPERKYFINKIVEVAPHYRHLWKAKPGITSWGQVKFGYAENVKEMVERLKFDILYIENMSLLMDLKILFYTVLIVLKGSGK